MSDHAASRNQGEARKCVCKHTVIQHRHPAGPSVTPRGKREAASEASSHLQRGWEWSILSRDSRGRPPVPHHVSDVPVSVPCDDESVSITFLIHTPAVYPVLRRQ